MLVERISFFFFGVIYGEIWKYHLIHATASILWILLCVCFRVYYAFVTCVERVYSRKYTYQCLVVTLFKKYLFGTRGRWRLFRKIPYIYSIPLPLTNLIHTRLLFLAGSHQWLYDYPILDSTSSQKKSLKPCWIPAMMFLVRTWTPFKCH